jgi:hypothetical protein
LFRVEFEQINKSRSKMIEMLKIVQKSKSLTSQDPRENLKEMQILILGIKGSGELGHLFFLTTDLSAQRQILIPIKDYFDYFHNDVNYEKLSEEEAKNLFDKRKSALEKIIEILEN